MPRTGSSAPPSPARGTAGSSPRRSSSPPSSPKPMASAMASTSVDFPVPLSPASSVTGAAKDTAPTPATAGTSNGKPSPQRASTRRSPSRYGRGPKRRASLPRRTAGGLRRGPVHPHAAEGGEGADPEAALARRAGQAGLVRPAQPGDDDADVRRDGDVDAAHEGHRDQRRLRPQLGLREVEVGAADEGGV